MNRHNTRSITIRNKRMGAQAPILLQSMTLSRPSDLEHAKAEIDALIASGADLIRLACLGDDDIEALGILTQYSSVPIITDIHFRPDLALKALEVSDKIRINPSNLGGYEAFKKVVLKAKELNKPMRIGFNQGSLKESGEDPAETLVHEALDWEQKALDLGYNNFCLSVKSSHIETCIRAYELLAKKTNTPLHIGLTESGTPNRGLVTSSLVLGTLLREGIGDTIRVSLSTRDRTQEIKAEKVLLSSLGLYKSAQLVSCPVCGRSQCNTISIAEEISDFLETLPENNLKVAVMGCAVNGPGEAKDADIGVAGGVHEALLFKKGEIIGKVPYDQIASKLKQEILKIIK